MRGTGILLAATLATLVSAPARAQLRDRAAQVDPLATRRWKVGNGPARATVIYLHGLGCSPDDGLITRLVGQLRASGESLQIVSPWLRPVRVGTKGKIDPSGLHTMSDTLARARAVIRNEPGSVVLMGHSLGGKAAFQLAQEFPDKVRCVIALAPSVNMLYSYWKGLTGERGLPDAQTINARLVQHKQELGVLLAQARQDRTRAGASRVEQLSGELGYLDVMKDMVGFNETAVEQRLRTPTLVLHGIDDEAVSIHYVRRLRDANPAVTLKEYESAGHGFAIEGLLGVDRRATSKLTADMAREISGFIREKAGQGSN